MALTIISTETVLEETKGRISRIDGSWRFESPGLVACSASDDTEERFLHYIVESALSKCREGDL